MAIDLSAEKPITITEAAKLAPGPVHVATIWRWLLKGCRGVRLESIVSGGRRYTSAEALERFIAATTALANGEPSPLRTRKQRERDVARAGAELDREGICR